MGEWFQSGGYGMFILLVIGASSLGYGAKVMRDPTEKGLATLRALPTLLVTSALFTFGTNLWAVNRNLSNDAFTKAHGIAATDLPFIGIIGMTEAAQALTLGGLLAFAVVLLRVVAQSRLPRRSAVLS